MVNEPVDDRQRHAAVVEELHSAGEVLTTAPGAAIGGNDQWPVLVEPVDQLEQHVARLPNHRQVAQLIDDKGIDLGQLGQRLH